MREFAHHRYTWNDYLALERSSGTKHEFFDGEIYAMAGGTPQHAQLSARLIGQLRAQLGLGPCETYTSDLRVRVAATGLATYPDVSIICGGLTTDPEDPNTATNPTLVVEVTSPSSEAYDRGVKLDHYRQVEALQEYVVVSHREALIEVFRRVGQDGWSRLEARRGATLPLTSVGASLDVAALYENVALTG